MLASCGYSPMLSTVNNKILNIEVVSHEGDKEINQVLRSKFKIHRNENEELIKISINSSYKKLDDVFELILNNEFEAVQKVLHTK